MEKNTSFHKQLKNELDQFLLEQNIYPKNELLKIDLHCHDYNSNVPDELLGRLLGVPETWLKSEKLLETLKKQKCDAFTITNHNNSRSCYELIEKGHDILVGAEFSVMVPDYKIGIHVLTYGFSKEDEKILNKRRYSVYEFLKYAHEKNIPTVWAHPLYHYSTEEQPSFEFFSKMALIFERFEVLNGQRDTWQNMLVKNWLLTITPEIIDKNAKLFDVDLKLYTNNPYKKSMTGGSDDHMGIFAGHSGSYLYVPNLKERLKNSSKSELALECLREHRIIPYGGDQNIEKLTIAFLDYVFQVALHFKQPDLLRIFLHKGTIKDKFIAVVISNLFTEVKYHKTIMLFIKLFHKSFKGKKAQKAFKLIIKKSYRPIFTETLHIAEAHNLNPEEMVSKFYESINKISDRLNNIFFTRIEKKIKSLSDDDFFHKLDIDKILEEIKLSPNIRDYLKNTSKENKNKNKRISDFLDGLSFPFLSSILILSANFLSSKVLYNNRKTLSVFSEKLNKLKHPKKILWLTDTFNDKNGISTVLQEIHKEILRLNLPIDILVCSKSVKPDNHLIVVKPEVEITFPFYKNQSIRIPNINRLHSLFLENEYDRVICSTEGIMGIISIMLKEAYSVPAYFYLHTDWIMFAKKALQWNSHKIDKVRRSLRFFYGNFDKLFVLNNDHKRWLASHNMGLDENNIYLTGHWVDDKFKPFNCSRKEVFGVDENVKVLLYAGRLSKEKGIMDIIEVYKKVKSELNFVKMVFAGTGPEEETLKKELPDAIFLGWVDSDNLPSVYSSSDLLLLPSTFDTFGLVVLEALSCGLPVIAYNSKGPKNIIINEFCGYLVRNRLTMSEKIIEHLSEPENILEMKQNAVKRSYDYSKNDIINKLLKDFDL